MRFNDERVKIVGSFIMATLLATLLKKYIYFIPIYILLIAYLLFKDNTYGEIINSFKNNDKSVLKESGIKGFFKKVSYELNNRMVIFKFLTISMGALVILIFLSDDSVITRLFLNIGDKSVSTEMFDGEIEIKDLNKEIKIKSFEEKSIGTFMTVENNEEIPWKNINVALTNYKGETTQGMLYGDGNTNERVYLFQNLKNFNDDYRLKFYIRKNGTVETIQEIRVKDLK